MFSSPFSEPQRQEPGNIAIAGTNSPLCRDHAVANFAMMLAKIRENEHIPIEKSVKCKKSILSDQPTGGGRSPLPPSPVSATGPESVNAV